MQLAIDADRSYLVAVVASILIHASVFAVIGIKWDEEQERRIIVPVNTVQAALMQLEERAPESIPRPAPVRPPEVDREALERAEEQRRAEELAEQQRLAALEEAERLAEQQRLEELRRLEEERLAAQRELEEQKRAEEEQKRLSELERLERLALEALQNRAEPVEAGAEQQAPDAIMSYANGMVALISQNWSAPASARNGMTVLLRVNLVPTGSLVSVEIIESSGDVVFDRAAVNAVRKTAPFEFLQELPISEFERNFRRFDFIFSPQNLRL